MKKNITKLVVVVALIMLLSLIIGITLPIIVASALMLILFLQLPDKIYSILYARVSISILIICSLYQLESIVFWLLRIQVTSTTYILIAFIATFLFVIYRMIKGFNYQKAFTSLKPSNKDLIILIPAIVLSGLVLTRAIAPKENNTISIVKSVTYATDDAVHISLLSDLLRSQSNLTAGRGTQYPTSISTNGSYPVGWHLSTSVITSSVVNTDNLKAVNIVLIYFVAKVISLFAAVASLSLFLIVLAERMKLKASSFLQTCIYIVLGISISTLFILPIYFDGFFSFFPVVIYMMTFASIFIQPIKRRPSISIEIVLILFTIASALTWVLTAPILLISLALRYYQHFTSIKKIPIKYYALLCIAGVVLLLQIYILLLDKSISISALTLQGGIRTPGPLLLTIGLLGYAIFHIKEKSMPNLRDSLFALITPAAFCLSAILLFIALNSSEITYYYYKLQIVILILIIPVASMYLIKIVEKNSTSVKKYLSGIIVVVFICILSIPSVVSFDYISLISSRLQHTVLSGIVSQKIVDTTLQKHFSNTNDRIYYFYPTSMSQTIIASNISRISYTNSACDLEVFGASNSGDPDKLAKEIIACSPTTPRIDIYTDTANYERLHTLIPETYFNTNEVIVYKL